MKIILLFILVAMAVASTCGGNCPAGDCPTCFCGVGQNKIDIATWCAKASWNQNCCKCITSHESDGNAHKVTYNPNGSSNVGLMQINTMNWTTCSGGSPPCDPSTHLSCAQSIYKFSGNSWKSWDSHKACGC